MMNLGVIYRTFIHARTLKQHTHIRTHTLTHARIHISVTQLTTATVLFAM